MATEYAYDPDVVARSGGYYSPRQRIVSLGISSPPLSPRDEAARKALMEKHARFKALQDKMMVDQESEIPQSRRKFERDPERTEPYSTGLIIGRDQGKEAMRQNKLDSQRRYHEQLVRDREMQPVDGYERQRAMREEQTKQQRYLAQQQMREEREREEPAPRSREELEAEMKRRVAKDMLAKNRYDAMLKQNDPSSLEDPKRMRIKARRQSGRQEEQEQRGYSDGAGVGVDMGRDASAYNFPIGESDKEMKDRKEQMRLRYIEQLEADKRVAQLHRGAGVDEEPSPRRFGVLDEDRGRQEYVDRTGWTSLDIGGSATGHTQSTARIESKGSRQQMYKQQLDDQRARAAEIARVEEQKWAGY